MLNETTIRKASIVGTEAVSTAQGIAMTAQQQLALCESINAAMNRLMRGYDPNRSELALKQIVESDQSCECDCDDELCCVKQGEYCPKCIARNALRD